MWNGHPHHHPYYPQPPIHPGDPRYAAAMALQLQQQQQQQHHAHHYAYANGHHPPPVPMAPPGYMPSRNDDSDDDGDDDDDNDDDDDSNSQNDDKMDEDDANSSQKDDDDEDDGSSSSSSDGDDSDSDDDDEDAKPSASAAAALARNSPSPPLPPQQPRGKPEAMAAQLASVVKEQQILEEQERQLAAAIKARTMEDDDNDDDDVALDSLAKHSTQVKSSAGTPKKATSSKKKAATTTPPKKKVAAPPKKKGTPAKRSPTPSKSSSILASIDFSNLPTMDDPVEPITKAQYEKLEEVMVQFCKVPLLAEFSRPVSVLHPELMGVYSKIVEHPIDLGKVCRRVRRRQYKNLRDVRLDTWRIFANCVKYHSHPNNKHAVPSFVSIALHLRDLFNDLWQEHMLPSDFPPPPPPDKATSKGNKKSNDPHADLRTAMEERAKDRKRRLVVSGLSIMNGNTLKSTADALDKFVENGGRVDQLDTLPIWGEGANLEDDDESDMEIVVENLRKFAQGLREMAARDEDLGVDELDTKIRKCYTDTEGLENMNTVLRMKIASRLGRFIGQLIVPVNEANCRGVSQSSVWGCMAAGVWARESSKKPFWPALVLGILAPSDQSEEWHKALTERNEARLPEKLKTQLMSGKRKAEQAIKRQAAGIAEPQSYFLVEFLGTHEFIWVREADIVENFNADEDPNKGETDSSHSKKKRISRSNLNSILASKTYANAIEEAQWALEEFELQLQDIGLESKESQTGEEGSADLGYSFQVLSQSDDEAESQGDEDPSKESLDIDECNELLATNGLLDYSTAGRKKRAQILKQHKLDAEKKKKAQKVKKDRADKAKKAKDAKLKEKEKKQEQRDLEKKRRKRTREREKALKGIEHQKKKLKLSDPAPGRRHLIISKRERAEAIVNGYINRTAKMGQYKTLSLGGGDEKWIPSAVIDSNNLCGMALAFRAAAGLIPMPNPVTTGPGKQIVKPWDAIKLQGKKDSEERCALLKQQIELVEKEIKIVRAQKEKRLALLKDAKQAVASMEDSIRANDEAARENPLKKARKSHPLSGKKRSKSTDDDEESVDSIDAVSKENDDVSSNGQNGEEPVVEVVVDSDKEQDGSDPAKNDIEDDASRDDGNDGDESIETPLAVVAEAN